MMMMMMMMMIREYKKPMHWHENVTEYLWRKQ